MASILFFPLSQTDLITTFEKCRVRVYDADVEDDEVIMWVEQFERDYLVAKANAASTGGI